MSKLYKWVTYRRLQDQGMHAEEQNHDLARCFNANNILLLHWAFSVLQQKIQQQLFVFDINRC